MSNNESENLTGDATPIAPERVGVPTSVEAVPTPTPDIADVAGAISDVAKNPEALPEYPTFTRNVASFSPNSASALKAELGLSDEGLLVGIPQQAAAALKLHHGDTVHVTTDGSTIFLEATSARGIKVITKTPRTKKALDKMALSKEIRRKAGVNDHRENTGAGKPDQGDALPFTVIHPKEGGTPMVWLKVDQKVPPKTDTKEE